MESNVKNKKQQAMPKSEAESFGIKRNPAIRAPRIYLSEEEIIRIMRKETAIKKKIGNLIDSMLCDDSQISEMDNYSGRFHPPPSFPPGPLDQPRQEKAEGGEQ